MVNDPCRQDCVAKTKKAILLTSIVNEPLMAFFALFCFILAKEFNATKTQIAIFLTLKPVLAIFSLYWSTLAQFSRKKIIGNVVWGSFLSRLPFFLLPFVHNVWEAIFLAAWFWFFYRGVHPAWIEIIKRNLPEDEQSKIYARGNAISYALSVVLALGVGPWMDLNPNAWRVMFPLAGIFSMVGVICQAQLTLVPDQTSSLTTTQFKPSSAVEFLITPWRHVLRLLKSRKDFVFFQWGFFFGGGAIMLMKPAEVLLVNYLPISYTHITAAIWTCKGLGFIATSSLWAKKFYSRDIYRLTAWVLVFTALCSFLFLGTQMPLASTWQMSSFFLAYFVYGVWQAGSHLIWPLSGISFSQKEESFVYTSVNVMTVGLRGLVMPLLGGALLDIVSFNTVFAIGAFMCLGGAYLMFHSEAFLKKNCFSTPNKI